LGSPRSRSASIHELVSTIVMPFIPCFPHIAQFFGRHKIFECPEQGYRFALPGPVIVRFHCRYHRPTDGFGA
jgi:hypothetical protein